MNKLSELAFGNNQKLNYYYDGSGRKLTKIYTPSSYYPTNTEYRGQMVHQYSNGTGSLKYIITSEGRLLNTGTNAAPVWGWEYDLKDHLGNTRVIFKPNATYNGVVRVEYANYFPFGMKMLAPYSTFSGAKYLYNGKEMQDDFGLNWYDYGARMYDAAIGRWHSVDPMAEVSRRWSPYNYCINNPIRYIDVDGMYSTEEWKKDNGITDDMLITVYQAPDSKDSSDENNDKSQKDNSKSGGNEASKSNIAMVPALGPAYVSGQYLDEGKYLEAAIWEAWAFADLFTLGYASKFKIAEKAAEKGVTVLGKYPDYINLASKLGGKRFNIPTNIWNKMTAAEQWAANVKFLDRMIARGDKIVLSNRVTDINKVNGAFRKELDYLISKGYRLSNNGLEMIK